MSNQTLFYVTTQEALAACVRYLRELRCVLDVYHQAEGVSRVVVTGKALGASDRTLLEHRGAMFDPPSVARVEVTFDPTTVLIERERSACRALHEYFVAQNQGYYHCDEEDYAHVIIDGRFNLREMVRAVLDSIV